MDRRQQKTQDAIFAAFSLLLEKKQYNSITVQEIIDEANIGRSTFYAHFETKDELLHKMCTRIFDHVSSKTTPDENDRASSHGSSKMDVVLSHVLYHLNEKHDDIKSLLRSESSDLFMKFFKDYLVNLFQRYVRDFSASVPEDFLLNHLVGSFAEAVKWWILNDREYTPEQVAEYYMSVLKK